MSRSYRNVKARWVFDPATKEMVEVPLDYKPKRVDAPAVYQDSMDAIEHPADGRMYDSKSAFRRVTKEHGLEERGNERRIASGTPVRSGMSDADYERSAKEAYEMVRSGNAPLSEYEREKCKRINQYLRNR